MTQNFLIFLLNLMFLAKVQECSLINFENFIKMSVKTENTKFWSNAAFTTKFSFIEILFT